MASAYDFMFQGSAPPTVFGGSTSTNQIPQYYQDYVKGVLSNAQAVSGLQYQNYGGQRIAKPNSQLNQAWAMTENGMGAWKPQFTGAGQNLAEASNGNASGAAQPYINSASGMVGAAGSSTVPGSVGAYMNPYNDLVTDRIAELGNRNFQENLLPGVGDMFTKAGQVGGTRHIGAVGRALRDTQGEISAAQGQALAGGYNTAATQFQGDANRQLQAGQAQGALGQIAGNFNSIDTRNNIDTAAGQMALGKATQTAGLTDAQALEAVGRDKMGEEQKNYDLAYKDFIDQRDYAKSNVDWSHSIAQGLPTLGSTTYKSESMPATNSMAMGPSALGQVAQGISLLNMFKNEGGYVDAPAAPRSYKKGGKVKAKTASPRKYKDGGYCPPTRRAKAYRDGGHVTMGAA